jgi:hypothetical protein
MPAQKLYDYNTSFSLMRTNPALSGNVKITVDSSGGVWLNSFDADTLLTSDIFKKYNVTGDKSYAEDLFTFFNPSVISSSVVFKVGRFTNGDIEASNNYAGQYDFFYTSGAQTLIDKNYEEEFSYLAPLWLRSELPDFFVIFKVPGPISYKYSENQTVINQGVKYKVVKDYDQDNFVVRYGTDPSGNPVYYSDGDFFKGLPGLASYSITSGQGSVVLFEELYNLENVEDVETYFTEKILPNSEAVKTYDLRSGTKIGDYIRGIFSNLGEQYSPVYINFGEGGFSYFNGISIQSGTYTQAGELMRDYFVSSGSTVQMDLERYVTEGFARNSIVCPNLLNLEFLFDDTEAQDYDINRYYGAYVSRNDTGEFKLNGNFLYEFRNSEGNENYPVPSRNAFGYYYDNTSYPVAATSGVRLYYEGASGFLPGSNDTNSTNYLKLFYVTDKNDNFYSLKRIENWDPSVTASSPYGYGPYEPVNETFGVTGSTGCTAGTFVLQNTSVDLLNFTGIDDQLVSARGFINGQNGRPYFDIKFLQNWNISNKDLVIKIYWPQGSRTEGAERYDIIRSGDFSGTIVWVAGSTYSSGNNYYFNASVGTPSEVAGAFSSSVYEVSDIVWDSGTVESSSVIRVKNPNDIGNSTYYVSVFDDYDYFESKYQWLWSPSSAYSTGDIVRYNGRYYQALSNISASPSSSNINPDDLEGVSWDLYYSLSSSGYIEVKGEDAAQVSGIRYFQGGTDKPRIRVAFDDDLLNLVKPGNFIQTEKGFSLISEIDRYVDDPIYDSNTKLVTGFNDYNLIRVAVISDVYDRINLGSDSRFNVFEPYILKTGVFTFFDFKDFDFDFWSSNYGITPNYETYRYFQLLPGTEGEIEDGIEYYVKNGSVSYDGTVYNQLTTFIGVSGATSFDNASTGNIIPVVYPLQFSDANYNQYSVSTGYEDDLDSFSGFVGIRSIEQTAPIPDSATKVQTFNYGLLADEYSYLKENYTVERANLSRIVPFINKWGYKDGTDSRGHQYRLNLTPAFTPSNFSPTFQNLYADPKYLTHEWFLLENVPRQFPVEFMKDQQSYVGSKIDIASVLDPSPNSSLYLSSYFTVSPSDYPVEYQDLKDETKEMFTEFSYNEGTGFYETVFRGAKVTLKKRSDFKADLQGNNNINLYVNGFRGYEGYRYASLLRVIPEDSTTIQSPVSYRFIENNTQKFIIFLVDVVMNDYKLQPLGYTGGTGGSPIVDYTLLYSLSNKNILAEQFISDQPLYTIADIKLSSALNLGYSSGSSVNTATNPGVIFIDPNPDYDTDLREEVNLTYSNSVAFSSFGYTGAGSFSVPSISCLYPWSNGVSEKFLEFGPIGQGSNYYFDIPFSFSSPVTVPVGAGSIYSGQPVFQVQGGEDYFDFITKRTSFSYVSERVNTLNPYVDYESYFYNETSSSPTLKIDDFAISFEQPAQIFKPSESRPARVFSSNAASNRPGLVPGKGPETQSVKVPNSYEIQVTLNGVPSQLLRHSGKYEPMFRKTLFFINDKTDTIPNTGIDLSFRNCTFGPQVYNFGIIKNLNYTKVSQNNILQASANLPAGPRYPLVGQSPIARKDFNVFQSSWDAGYYNDFTTATVQSPVAGTRAMLERKSFLGSKIMKTPSNVIIDNQIVLQVSNNSGITDVSAINLEAFNSLIPIQSINAANSGTQIGLLTPYNNPNPLSTINNGIFPNVEILWKKINSTTINGVIRLDRMLRRYLMNDGVGDVFLNNIISEFGVGDPASIQDDILSYLELNIAPVYEGSILQVYVKKTATGVQDPKLQVRGDIAATERLRLGYIPDKNLILTKVDNLVYNFSYKLESGFNYQLIFRFNIDKI